MPAAAQFYKLIHDRLGIQLADAAAPFATAGLVRHTLEPSGFTSIQVCISLACMEACITISKTIGENWNTYSGYLGKLQVDTTEEHILYKDCDALDYAHKTWKLLSSNAIMTPLDALVRLYPKVWSLHI